MFISDLTRYVREISTCLSGVNCESWLFSNLSQKLLQQGQYPWLQKPQKPTFNASTFPNNLFF